MLQFEAPMICVGANLLYETPDPEDPRDYSELFKKSLVDVRRGESRG